MFLADCDQSDILVMTSSLRPALDNVSIDLDIISSTYTGHCWFISLCISHKYGRANPLLLEAMANTELHLPYVWSGCRLARPAVIGALDITSGQGLQRPLFGECLVGDLVGRRGREGGKKSLKGGREEVGGKKSSEGGREGRSGERERYLEGWKDV